MDETRKIDESERGDRAKCSQIEVRKGNHHFMDHQIGRHGQGKENKT
jgi:hypothetical protein